MTYSVLMSVYPLELPERLRMAIQSVLDQTLQTNNFVIVEDGCLPIELENVLRYYEQRYPSIVTVHRRQINRGLGYSLREGIMLCENNFIARMDSDDFSLPNRCKIQVNKLLEGYSLVGSDIEEFTDSPNHIIAIKHMPVDHAAIKRFAKFRNPFNHPSVMFTKQAVLEAGNYRDFYRLEDYDLWARMLSCKIRCCNIPQVLVKMRVDSSFYARRGGYQNLLSHIKLKKEMWARGQITVSQFLLGCALIGGRCYIPGGLKKWVYSRVLRHSIPKRGNT